MAPLKTTAHLREVLILEKAIIKNADWHILFKALTGYVRIIEESKLLRAKTNICVTFSKSINNVNSKVFL